MISRKWVYLAVALMAFCIAPLRNVHAYIDPGTGNYLLQIILAALFGALFALKICWAKIKAGFLSVRSALSGDRQKQVRE